jgi:hypothetical protein
MLLIMIYAPNLFSKTSESYLEQSSPHEHQKNELTHVHFIVNTSNVICKLSYPEFMMLYLYYHEVSVSSSFVQTISIPVICL